MSEPNRVFLSQGEAVDSFAAGEQTSPLWSWRVQIGDDRFVLFVFAKSEGGAQREAIESLSKPSRVGRNQLDVLVRQRLSEVMRERVAAEEGGTGAIYVRDVVLTSTEGG